jgi:hypothetical protein
MRFLLHFLIGHFRVDLREFLWNSSFLLCCSHRLSPAWYNVSCPKKIYNKRGDQQVYVYVLCLRSNSSQHILCALRNCDELGIFLESLKLNLFFACQSSTRDDVNCKIQLNDSINHISASSSLHARERESYRKV